MLPIFVSDIQKTASLNTEMLCLAIPFVSPSSIESAQSEDYATFRGSFRKSFPKRALPMTVSKVSFPKGLLPFSKTAHPLSEKKKVAPFLGSSSNPSTIPIKPLGLQYRNIEFPPALSVLMKNRQSLLGTCTGLFVAKKPLGLDSEIVFFRRRRFTRLAINKVSQSNVGFDMVENRVLF